MSRLVRIRPDLDRAVGVAKGNLTSQDVHGTWLEPVAKSDVNALPAEVMQRWYALFSDEIEIVYRAINSVQGNDVLSDGNAAAAVEMGDKILRVAQEAADSARTA